MVFQTKKKKLVKVNLLTFAVLVSSISCICINVHADEGTSNATVKVNPSSQQTDPHDPTDPNQMNVPPKDSIDVGNMGTGESGDLTMDYLPNLFFEDGHLSDEKAEYSLVNTHPFIQVSDYRGSDKGWQISVQSSKLTSKDGDEIRGANIHFNKAQIKTMDDNTSDAPTLNSTMVATNQTTTNLLTATKDTGRGTWLATFENKHAITLEVPANEGKVNHTYKLTLTWLLADTPA